MTLEPGNSKQINTRHRRIAFGPTILRLAPLLANRDYRSRELALELRMEKKEVLRVREWCRYGLPHTRDATGHLLINGHAFANWVRGRSGRRARRTLPPGHMWCPGCNQPQPFEIHSSIISHDTGRPRRVALCPRGHSMSQWISRRDK